METARRDFLSLFNPARNIPSLIVAQQEKQLLAGNNPQETAILSARDQARVDELRGITKRRFIVLAAETAALLGGLGFVAFKLLKPRPTLKESTDLGIHRYPAPSVQPAEHVEKPQGLPPKIAKINEIMKKELDERGDPEKTSRVHVDITYENDTPLGKIPVMWIQALGYTPLVDPENDSLQSAADSLADSLSELEAVIHPNPYLGKPFYSRASNSFDVPASHFFPNFWAALLTLEQALRARADANARTNPTDTKSADAIDTMVSRNIFDFADFASDGRVKRFYANQTAHFTKWAEEKKPDTKYAAFMLGLYIDAMNKDVFGEDFNTTDYLYRNAIQTELMIWFRLWVEDASMSPHLTNRWRQYLLEVAEERFGELANMADARIHAITAKQKSAIRK